MAIAPRYIRFFGGGFFGGWASMGLNPIFVGTWWWDSVELERFPKSFCDGIGAVFFTDPFAPPNTI